MITHHCPIRKVSPDDGYHYWFGYYDKCPWSADKSKLLAHRAPCCDRLPSIGDLAEVGYIEGWKTHTPRFVKVGQTSTWNWQQGAMLRWDGSHIRYNTLESEPVYTYHQQADVGLTLDFGRLTRLRREYGYAPLTDPAPEDPHPATCGIYRLDPIRTPSIHAKNTPQQWRKTLIISIDQLDLITADNSPRAGGALHQHVNHLMFNPSGTRFCFMHRFVRSDGILHSRLFTSDLEGNDIRLLFEGLVSHYDWRDDDTILAWAGRRSLLGKANAKKSLLQQLMTIARRCLKPIYYALGKPRFLMNKIMKDSYLLIADRDCCDAHAPAPVPFAKGELICDGHCTFNRNDPTPGRWVLTDGYPDRKHRQPLYLWDCAHNLGYEIGRYPTPPHLDGDIRVDLHPRFNHDATLVCIDSAMDGKRAMYTVDIAELTKE